MDIDFARPVFDHAERHAVNRVLEGHWLASGKENEAFEREFSEYIGMPHALVVNSGSSANLIALASLDLPRGAKVITSGCGFPATLSPIIHLGYEPVLVDYDRSTFNIDVQQVIDAMPGAKAVLLAHTMGSPVDMQPIIEAAWKHGALVIEDCCEALGATINGKQVGAFGNVGTYSFYPSHQITAGGGGGMVTFHDKQRFARAKSLRDWGKLATWDNYGRNNTSYSIDVDGVPYFPHYVYSTVGWNFKLPEMNCAFGREQMKRMDWIVSERKRNHDYIASRLPDGYFEKHAVVPGANPSWFGVVLASRYGGRDDIGNMLEKQGIRHRPFFAGNITRHPPFAAYRKHFPVADWLMENALFVGCYAGMTQDMLDYIVEGIEHAAAASA